MADVENNVVEDSKVEEKEEEEEQLDLTNVKKKKKKKKPKINLDLDGETDVNGGSSKSKKVSFQPDEENDDEGVLDLSTMKKKRKKERKQLDGSEISADAKDGDGSSWSGMDRDYTYDELLTRAFHAMKQLNPDMIAGEKRRFIMKPPQCARVGTKKTSFINFAEICNTLHRQPKHILAFILAELGASGSVDGNNQLIIKGRFQQKQLESVLRRYIKEYVTCHTCKSPDTLLERDVRLYFLRCNKCKSSCSVTAIKNGFQAFTGKRARLRAKAGS